MQAGTGTRDWLEHLTDRDLDLLAGIAPLAGIEPAQLRSSRERLELLLADRRTFEAVFGRPEDREPGRDRGRDRRRDLAPAASPFLVFAVAVHRGWAELDATSHVEEWIGPRRRLPVLSGPQLREFLDEPSRRLFLTELLASYTRVASGTTWFLSQRGWQRRRFSELHPVQLASLLDVVPEQERPGVYRRLGDLALFLTGVFPDHTETSGLGPYDTDRLLRLGALGTHPPPLDAPATTVSLLEYLGQRSYRIAARTSTAPLTRTMAVVADISDQFSLARRALNYLSDRYLFTDRQRWFGPAPT
jgi:hypothetical protein